MLSPRNVKYDFWHLSAGPIKRNKSPFEVVWMIRFADYIHFIQGGEIFIYVDFHFLFGRLYFAFLGFFKDSTDFIDLPETICTEPC